MNLPTKITCARILLIPLMFVMFCLREIFEYYYLLEALIFAVCAATDFVDGYIARKNNMVTDLGKFLDPIADKILVVAGLVIILADTNVIGINIYFTVAAIIVILAREFIIGVFRQIAAAKGSVLQADKLGKIKTASTLIGITMLLLAPLKNVGDIFAIDIIGEVFFYLGYIAFAFAVLMTIISGVNYIIKNKDVLKDNGGNNE